MNTPCPRCGTSVPVDRLAACPRCLLEPDDPPALIAARYQLIDEIGSGGMGSVYRAHDIRDDRSVAVKLLPADLAALPEFQKRFEREARALSKLDHHNITRIYDVGIDADQHYIVMELVAGSALIAHLPLAVDRALNVALQLCSALAYAHRLGVVHRDVKPENILLDADDQVKLSDFGIARLTAPGDAGWTITAAESTAGTPHYIAPEALAGAPPDPRMDVYSLGVVLYQMVTGKLPIGDFDRLPAALDRIVRRALAPDPVRRYRSIDEMAAALTAAQQRLSSERLPADEQTWIYAVAMLQTLATAVALWAFLLSVTPRVLHRDEVMPLIMIGPEHLADGRILSRARFETWPTLAAIAGGAVALTAYGVLRWHWRRNGLEQPEPEHALPESRWVLIAGVVACLIYAIRQALEPWHFALLSYTPIVGGVIEIVALFLVWAATLQAWRRSRPLQREATLWIGFALALVAPIADLVIYVSTWQP